MMTVRIFMMIFMKKSILRQKTSPIIQYEKYQIHKEFQIKCIKKYTIYQDR
jgi:hypothetical protein